MIKKITSLRFRIACFGILRAVLNRLGFELLQYNPKPSLSPQIGGPDNLHYLSITNVDLTQEQQHCVENFRTDRYYWINEYRWRLLRQTGITFKQKVVFESGAGIGDQTAWLLNQGASKVIVSEGRDLNLSIVKKRFSGDSRISILPEGGDLELYSGKSEFEIEADIVFLWGVYYHILDPLPNFPILHKLSRVAPIIVMDYQESTTGSDWIETYGYENPSASMHYSSWRQTSETMAAAVQSAFGHAYFPAEQMNWVDPSTPKAPRRIIIGSSKPLNHLPGLIEILK
jgi:hypothetical protein